MRKRDKLTNIMEANKRLLGEDLNFDTNHPEGFGKDHDSVGDYRADTYGQGKYHDPSDMYDRDFNSDEWDEGEEYDSFEDYKQSPFYGDKKNQWSNRLPGEQGRKFFNQEKEARGGTPLKIHRRR